MLPGRMGLARIGGNLDHLLPIVIKMLEDPSQELRGEAIRFLQKFGRKGSSEIRPALLRVAKDRYSYVG